MAVLASRSACVQQPGNGAGSLVSSKFSLHGRLAAAQPRTVATAESQAAQVEGFPQYALQEKTPLVCATQVASVAPAMEFSELQEAPVYHWYWSGPPAPPITTAARTTESGRRGGGNRQLGRDALARAVDFDVVEINTALIGGTRAMPTEVIGARSRRRECRLTLCRRGGIREHEGRSQPEWTSPPHSRRYPHRRRVAP